MKILQTRNKKWFLDKRLIISRSQSLKNEDLVFCDETLDYATMNSSHMVMESYEEMREQLMLCYVAFLRFSEFYQHDPKYVWVNKDAGSVMLDSLYGKNCFYIGPVAADYYKIVKNEIKALAGRSLVVEFDWFIRFRDDLILNCY